MNINEKSIFKNLDVLYIDNTEISTNSIYNSLKDSFNTFQHCKDLEEAMEVYVSRKLDLIITEIDEDTFGFIKNIKDVNIHQSIVILTNNNNAEYMSKAFDLYVDNYISKELSIEQIYEKIAKVVKKLNLRKHKLEKNIILQNILDNQSGITIVTDFEKAYFASKSFLKFFNFDTLDDYKKLYSNLLDIFATNENYLSGSSKAEFLNNYKNASAIEKVVLLLNKSFEPKAFHINIDEINDFTADQLYIISLTNISLLQEQNIKFSHKAYIDGLTGIFNRNKFEEVFEYELSRFKRFKEEFCIAILDVDHFKKFNDTYGHIIGDEVLVSMAQTINEKVREIDTFARWGGEEFVLIMPSTSLEGAKILCEDLRIKISNIHHETAGSITSSFGITKIEEDDTLLSIFKRCDEALYNAKANGRNRVETI